MLKRDEEGFFHFVLVDLEVADRNSGFDLTNNWSDDGRTFLKCSYSFRQRTLTVRLTSLTSLDLTEQVKLLLIKHKQSN